MERPPRARSAEQQGSQRQQGKGGPCLTRAAATRERAASAADLGNAALGGATIERRGRSARSLVDDVGEAEVAVLVHGHDADAAEDPVLEPTDADANTWSLCPRVQC